MSATLCHVHGRAGVGHVCSHIRAALDRRATLPAWTSYTLPHPPDYVVVRMCDACVALRSLPVPGRMLADDDIVLDQLGTDPYCEACFVELTSEP
jgi:hypothetical protein